MHKLIKGLFGLFIVFLLGYGVFFCFQQIKNDKSSTTGFNDLKDAYDKSETVIRKQYIYACYELRDAAKLFYTESCLNTPISSGDVTQLSVYGKRPTSGTWYLDETGKMILENVVYDSYVCSTVMDENKDTIDCQKQDVQ